MYAQSHRSNASMSNLSLPVDEPFTPPTHRLSMPVPAGALVESPTRARSRARSKSPLRNSMTYETQSTEGSPMPHDDDPWGQRGGPMYSPSLNSAPSVARFANNLAQRVNSLFNEPRSPSLLPTDAQLEAEAAAERDRSRREAERILNREAEERRRIEEGVMQTMRQNSLPPPPHSPSARGRSTSPARKDKDGGWWNAAKQRLTPTKELTPAQQIIQETKAKEKQRGKSKDVSPGRERTLSTPSIPPVALQQNVSLSGLPGASPARDGPPLYAQFGGDGSLDVTSTLMTIARRFEKLERWTVGHVRALEERMNDVEKWLVDKEKEKEKESGSRHTADPSTLFEQAAVAKDVEDMKDELSELKGRIAELGKGMVVMRRDASRPLPAPAPAPAQPQPRATGVSPVMSPLALGSTFSSESINSTSSRTRASFPAGDYRSNNSSMQSPPTSPRARSPAALPPSSGPSLAQTLRTPSPLPPVAERTTSPAAISPTTPQASSGLPAPPTQRPPSVSPPRKRYTVALGGGPITQQREQLQTAYFSSAPTSEEPGSITSSASESEKTSQAGDEEGISRPGADLRRKETIGSTPIAISRLSLSPPARAQPDPVSTSPSPMVRTRPRPQSAVFNTSPSPGNSRSRTQSTYGGTGLTSPAPRPDPHNRSKSIDRFGLGFDAPLTPGGSGKFVDPLVARRKDTVVVSPKPVLAQGKGKIPIGQLVAFFDGDKNPS